jgi:hypothetical protein
VTDDLADFWPPTEPRPALASPRKCLHPRYGRKPLPNGDVQCGRCDKVIAAASARRGRIARQSGNTAERDWCKRLRFTRVGHFGGVEDGLATNGMFVGQAKSFAAGRFPTWMSVELDKLPRTNGRIPVLGILEKPGSGHRPRRLVVMDEADWIALHAAEVEG